MPRPTGARENIEDDDVLANSWIAIVQKADSPLLFVALDAALQSGVSEKCVAMAQLDTDLLPGEADHPHQRAIGIFGLIVGSTPTDFGC